MKKAICTAYVMIQLIIVSLLLFAAGSTDYYTKRELSFSNAVYTLAGVLVTALICLAVSKYRGRFGAFFSARKNIIVIVTLMVFFCLSLFICIGGFFFSDWDPAAILYGVYGVLHGHPEDTGAVYFSNHPNNLLLVWLYLAVLRMTGFFDIESVLTLVVFQCVLSTLAAYVFYRILGDMTEDPVTAYTGLIIYGIWIVLSPWFIITYSDEAGIIIPLLILRLFQRLMGTRGDIKRSGIYLAALCALAAAGYYIKPQIIISFFAVVLIYVFDIKGEKPGYRAGFLIYCALLTFMFALIIKSFIIPSAGIKTDAGKSFGMAHYFMMGLNDETDGVYSDEDTLYTDAFDTPAEKNRADMELAGERIRQYGAAGLLSHAGKKTLVNYSDGLFAWGVDGSFFAGRELEDIGAVPETAATGFIWSLIRPDGACHGRYSSVMQMIWVTVQILGLICGIIIAVSVFAEKKDVGENAPSHSVCDCTVIFAVMLSLAGLFIFELLFEAKARYLFIYTPYFLLAAVCGARAVSVSAAKVSAKRVDKQEGTAWER